MRRALNFWVLGGDMRQAKLAQLLAEDGHRVHTFALEDGVEPAGLLSVEKGTARMGEGDCVVLPLPASDGKGRLNAPLSGRQIPMVDLLDAMTPEQVICGGMLDPATSALAAERRLSIQDYFAREELQIANAVPTAEGAIQIAMEQLPITLSGARGLVIGYGRTGKLVAQRMAALGARVSVAARRYEHLAWARALGYGAEHTSHLAGWLCGYDLVVNTVPARVLGQAELADLKPDCLAVACLEEAARLGRSVVWALSLPGKVAPVSAGAAVRDTVYHILHELGR